MPRRSPEHLDARRRQILDAARRCFARNGFHATSMQDVFGETGLSAGAVYRYFPGKEHIVVAIAAEALAEITGAVVGELHTGSLRPLHEVMGEMLERFQRFDEDHDMGRLAVLVWGEAVRSPEIAKLLADELAGMRELLGRLIDRYRAEGMLAGHGSTEEIARVITAVTAGFIMQRAVLRDVDAATFRAGLAELIPAQRTT
jgi:TetR/AcrR family transcriptional regulator, transcriptional repressor of aconitase